MIEWLSDRITHVHAGHVGPGSDIGARGYIDRKKITKKKKTKTQKVRNKKVKRI